MNNFPRYLCESYAADAISSHLYSCSTLLDLPCLLFSLSFATFVENGFCRANNFVSHFRSLAIKENTKVLLMRPNVITMLLTGLIIYQEGLSLVSVKNIYFCIHWSTNSLKSTKRMGDLPHFTWLLLYVISLV